MHRNKIDTPQATADCSCTLTLARCRRGPGSRRGRPACSPPRTTAASSCRRTALQESGTSSHPSSSCPSHLTLLGPAPSGHCSRFAHRLCPTADQTPASDHTTRSRGSAVAFRPRASFYHKQSLRTELQLQAPAGLLVYLRNLVRSHQPPQQHVPKTVIASGPWHLQRPAEINCFPHMQRRAQRSRCDNQPHTLSILSTCRGRPPVARPAEGDYHAALSYNHKQYVSTRPHTQQAICQNGPSMQPGAELIRSDV